jgi:hypothetical protein
MVGERRAHHVVLAPAEPSPYYMQFTTDPGVFWGEVVSDRYLKGRDRLGAGGAARLEWLGWRAPDSHLPNWFQYFQPMRKRDYRWLAGHVLATFRDGLRVREPVVVWALDTADPACGPTFVTDEDAAEACDRELLGIAASVLSRFEPEAHDDHLEVTMRRKRHSVRIGVFAREGTISCAALHLPAPEPAVVEAAFAVSDELDRVPYTYALRTVTGHGDSLVLLSKVAVMPEQRIPPVVGLLLYSTIEPLVAAHRQLHR